jgi:hypothetical protein
MDPPRVLWHHPAMTATSRLGRQIQELLAALEEVHAVSALIGGLALAPHKVVRATQDVDLLTRAADADAIHAALVRLGYRCMHRSADAANYLRADERVDLLYAHRPIALQLLEEADPRDSAFGTVRVIGLEGLVAFKLQGYVNDSRRTQDLEDIRALLRANRDTVDWVRLREYFRLFNRESLLDEILADVG